MDWTLGLDEFTAGDPITSITGLNPDDFRKAPARCRLVKTAESAAVHLVCGKERRTIIREGVFHQFGWEFRDVETVAPHPADALARRAHFSLSATGVEHHCL